MKLALCWAAAFLVSAVLVGGATLLLAYAGWGQDGDL